MNVLITTGSLVRTFEVGDRTADRSIQDYSLQGNARLEVARSYDGPTFDDQSGPSDEAKYHAVHARIATSVTFVPESLWADKVDHFLNRRSFDAKEHDREAMSAAAAYAWYVPTNEKLVREYGGPKYDELDCYLKTRDAQVTDLKDWLDRAACESRLLPTIALYELYFHSDEPVISWLVKPGPAWADFLKMRRAGTFEGYSVRFRSPRSPLTFVHDV